MSSFNAFLRFSGVVGGRQVSYSPGSLFLYCRLSDLQEIYYSYKEAQHDPRFKRLNEALFLCGHARRRKFAIGYGDMTQMDGKRVSDIVFIDQEVVVSNPFETILIAQDQIGVCRESHRMEIASFSLCEGFVDGAFDHGPPAPVCPDKGDEEALSKDRLFQVAKSGAEKVARKISPHVKKLRGIGVTELVVTHLHRGRSNYPTGCLAKRLHEHVDFQSML